jgi:hypothetical protein
MTDENNILYSKPCLYNFYDKCVDKNKKNNEKYNKIIDTVNEDKKNIKSVNNLIIPSLSEIKNCDMKKYKVIELKKICSFYKVKNYYKKKKDELILSLIRISELEHFSTFIQKNARRFIIQSFLNNKSPNKTWLPSKRMKICKNQTDFYTLENLDEIPLSQYICYVDENNCYWGFNILSLYNYFKHQYHLTKNTNKINNPYTNLPFNNKFMTNFKHHVYISQKMGFSIKLNVDEEEDNKNDECILNKLIEDNVSIIERHGYFIQTNWITDISKNMLIRFIYELMDIWCYRSQISPSVQRQICHPSGNPFEMVQNINILNNKEYNDVALAAHKIINNFISTGITYSDCQTGTLYVLSALTLVSRDFEQAFPYIYLSARL